MLTAVRIISFSALAFAVLASAARAEELTDAGEELTDAGMDQITAGGFFELAADELDMTTSAPVGPLQHNVIGGVGVLLEAFLSEAFRSQQSLQRDLASAAPPTPSTPNPGATPLPNALSGSPLGTTPITGSPLGTTPIAGSPLGTAPI